MSALSPAESAFAELLERCRLPGLTTLELLEMFLAQSTALESAKRELATLRDTGAAKRAFDASVGRGEGPPALSIVRPVTDCGVLGCDQLACKGDIFTHRREIDDFGNLLPEASK